MKKMMLFLVLFFSCSSLLMAQSYHFYGETDQNPLSYKPNEEMVFSVQLLDGDNPVIGKTLKWERHGDDGVNESGQAESAAEPLIIKAKTDKPGFVQIVVNAFEPDGSPIEVMSFIGSAGVEWQKLEGLPEPEDFDEFWASQRKKLDAVPFNTKMVPVDVPEDPNHLYYDIKVDCIGKPVSGYFCKPKNAEPKSLPIKIAFIGYNYHSAFLPTWAHDYLAIDPSVPIEWAENPDRLREGLTLNINAHGYENGMPQEYYDNLANTTLKKYAFIKEENENRETAYFLGMFLRLMRAIEWAKQQPEWDGQTIVVAGGSQGGLQALAAAGLDPDVSECYAFIPWGCNLGGYEKQGRVQSIFCPEYTEALRYFDAANHAKRIRGKVYIVSGLGDYCCQPASQAVLYNNIQSPKRIEFHQGMQHPQVMPGEKIYIESKDWN